MEIILETQTPQEEPVVVAEPVLKWYQHEKGWRSLFNASQWKAWLLAWVLFVLTPFLWVGRMAIVSYYWAWIHTFGDKKIRPDAKCPACGVRKLHKIQYSEVYHSVLHRCEQCSAEWGTEPIYPFEKWQIARRLDQDKQQPLWKVDKAE